MVKQSRLKKGLKKILCYMMTFLMVISNLTITPVSAADGVISINNSVNWSFGGTSWGEAGLMTINGQVVYCLERLKSVNFGGTYVDLGDNFSSLGINNETKTKLSLLAYFGNKHAVESGSVDWHAVVANAIWKELEPTHELRGYTLSPTFDTLEKNLNAIQTLENDVANYYIVPSFTDATYNVKVGETIRLTDTNGVLNTFKITNSGGLDARIEGNELVITGTADADENAKIQFKKNISASETGVSILYSAGNDAQKVASFKVFDPIGGNVKFNVQKYGSLSIEKRDNKNNTVAGTQFKISYKEDMSNPIGTYTTGSDGKVKIDNLLPQTVYVQEVSVPEHLVLDSTIHKVTIEPNQTASFTATNNWKQGYIQVTKKDADTGKVVTKAGTVFEIYDSNNQKVTTITTNESGVATSGLLDYGTYYVKEATAPQSYTVKVQVSDNVGVVENGKTYEITVSNKRVTGTLNLSKVDSVNGKNPLAEATLQGAVYGLYARNDILDPADGSVIYKAGTKINELTTDAQGNTSIDNLYLGNYYIKEITAPEGYVLDTNEYDFSLTYENQNVAVVTKDQEVKDRVISQAFSIIKISSDTTGESELLKGAEFTVKLKKDVDALGWDNAPIAKNADGQDASVLVTDSQGYAVSDRLPYGTYVVRETKTPDEKYTVSDFTVTVTEDSSDPQPYRVFNDMNFTSVLKIVKKDAETGKTVLVEGAKFKIKNLDTNEYYGYWSWNPLPHYVNTWTTTEDGYLMTGDKLTAGHYQLEEIASPNGYLLSETPIEFTISNKVAYETLDDGKTPVISVEFADVSVKGQINVEKRGEVLTGYKDGQFVYEERGLAGMKVNVYAKEDIMDPSNDGTVLYKAGTLVDTITTGTDGKATSKKLPLGKYEVEEIEAPHGMILNGEKQDVELKYKDQTTAVVFDNVTIVNDRQKVEAKLQKVDKDNGIALEGGVFNLVAKEDIKNADGEVIVKAGTVLNTYTSDEEGNISIDLDLPIDHNFQLVETKAPTGYELDETPVEFNTKYQGQDTKVIEISKTKENQRTRVTISKTDMTTGEELAGNHMKVFEKDNPGSVFAEWVSDDKPVILENLDTNVRFVLRETSSVKGFYLANDIEFELDEYGKLYIYENGEKVPADENKIVMENDLVKGRLEWNKTGEIFNHTITGQNEFGTTQTPVWEESNLLGTEITIYAAEDITLGNGVTYYHKDEAIQTLESDFDAVQSQDLLVGKYYYTETTTPHGYVVDTDKHYFEIEDNQSSELQIVKSTLENERPTINIEFTKYMEKFQHHNKVDEAYKDVVFGIYAREDIYDYQGNVAIENGTLIDTTGIDELGQLDHVPDLPNGTYYLKELQTNSDYVLDTNEYDFEIAYHGKDVSGYTVVIGNGSVENELVRGSIEIKKNDSFDDTKKLKDVEFNISSNADMSDIITTVKTDENGIARFEDMEIGEYYIQEAKQVDGYTVNDHIYEVEITTDGSILTVDVDNKPTEMEFSKVDETGKSELPGAEIVIIDKETGKEVDRWTSTDESHKIKYLVEGKEYIMKEITAPNGYKVAEEITFVAGDGNKVTMKDELILTDIQVNKVDSVSKEAILSKDFVFGLYSDKECTQLITTVHANKENGTATFKDLRYGIYYIKELEAPKGYQLSKEVKEIIINDDLEGVGDVHSFIYENTLLPATTINTGDNTNITLYAITGCLALAGILLIFKRKKENELQ